MSDNPATICPWCQTEIVWDEEIGPEETCPNCFNELGDYRSLHVRLEGDELQLSSGDEDELTELSGYQLAVRQRLEQQEDGMECPRCQEEMVLAGTTRLTADTFTPYARSEEVPAFIEPPFAVNLFVCPSCFQVAYSLADEDRVRLVNEWSRPKGTDEP